MIRIVEEDLDEATDLLDIAEYCRFSHYCLWDKRERLPFIFRQAGAEFCPGEDCPIIVFRRKFEAESPAFYAAALNFSKTKNAIKNALKALETNQGSNRCRRRRYLRRLDEMKTFDHLILVALYPLSLKAETIPDLTQGEITALLKKYNSSEEERRRNLERMGEINSDWVYWIDEIGDALLSENKQDIALITFLVYLFIEGLEKDQLPDLGVMSKEEKGKFFVELLEKTSPKKK